MVSAGEAVNGLRPDHACAALAVLKMLRGPSAYMVAVGDTAIWKPMVLAAIEDETMSES